MEEKGVKVIKKRDKKVVRSGKKLRVLCTNSRYHCCLFQLSCSIFHDTVVCVKIYYSNLFDLIVLINFDLFPIIWYLDINDYIYLRWETCSETGSITVAIYRRVFCPARINFDVIYTSLLIFFIAKSSPLLSLSFYFSLLFCLSFLFSNFFIIPFFQVLASDRPVLNSTFVFRNRIRAESKNWCSRCSEWNSRCVCICNCT